MQSPELHELAARPSGALDEPLEESRRLARWAVEARARAQTGTATARARARLATICRLRAPRSATLAQRPSRIEMIAAAVTVQVADVGRRRTHCCSHRRCDVQTVLASPDAPKALLPRQAMARLHDLAEAAARPGEAMCSMMHVTPLYASIVDLVLRLRLASRPFSHQLTLDAFAALWGRRGSSTTR
jgi:hypothetical protein